MEAGYTFPVPASRYVSYTAAGENGFVSVADDGTATTHLSTGKPITERVQVDSNAYYRRFGDLVAERLAAGFPGLPTLTDLRRTIRLVDSVYRSQPHRTRTAPA